MKVSFITTVFNEGNTIDFFLDSLQAQTIMLDEIIVVDGGSKDDTVKNIKHAIAKSNYKKRFQLYSKKGNRSIGRNEAIKHSTGDIIVCSDAGNILDKDWVKNIVKPFQDQKVDVVAGYYKGLAKNIFQKCLIPYVFVMPDKLNPDTFLPATRSIAFRKALWRKVGGFNERLSHNEDYAFARKIKDAKATIAFAKDAIVIWIPRSNVKEAFIMFFRFAYGDAEAGIWRPKVVLIFARYVVALVLVVFAIFLNSKILFISLVILFVIYCFWSVQKNYRYVKKWQAYYLLPMLQFTSDSAVLLGSILGLYKFKLWKRKNKMAP